MLESLRNCNQSLVVKDRESSQLRVAHLQWQTVSSGKWWGVGKQTRKALWFPLQTPKRIEYPMWGAPGQALHGWLPEAKATRGKKLPALLVHGVPMSNEPELRETHRLVTIPNHLNLKLTKHPLQSPNPWDQTEEHYLLLTATNAWPKNIR